MSTLRYARFALTLASLAALGSLSTPPAAAGIIVTGPTVSVSGNFMPTYGQDGYIEFDTTPSGTTNGDFNTGGQHDALVANPGPNTPATTFIAAPSYVSSFAGKTVNHASGYSYSSISTGLEAGQIGGNGGDIFSFTVGATVPAAFQFGVLADYNRNDAGANTGIITLTSSKGYSASDTDNNSSGTSSATGYDYLFNISGATAGETFTVSTSAQGYIAGATFDSASPAPEPSQVGILAMMTLGLGGLILRARKRHSTAAL